MNVYFSTVIRSAPPLKGGELVKLDWGAKRVVARVPIAATNPTINDPNPRGNTRGGRGIEFLSDHELMVCSFHSLRIFDRDLSPIRDLTHPLMVSLHESCLRDDRSLWVSSTAVDAALLVDYHNGEILRSVWPREMPGFQREFGLTPLSIDKGADNRSLFLGSDHYQHPHHVHLNAIALHDGELFALFSRFGAIVNLDRDVVVASDKGMKGAHNLVISRDGVATVSHSLGRGLLRFRLNDGERVEKISFARSPVVRKLVRHHDVIYNIRRFLARHNLYPATPPRPLFVRGLSRHEGDWFVGISPASILRVNDAGEVLDHFIYQRDVNACIHGIAIEP